MKLELQKHSRSRILAAIILGLMAVFVLRLFYLQVIKHDDYVAMAAQEQVKRLTIPAKRGLIYAMDGESPAKLVMNQTVYTLFADPKLIAERKDAAKMKSDIIVAVRSVAGGNTVKDFEQLLDYDKTRYQILAKQLTRKQAELIKEKQLPGVGFQEVSRRVYPEGGLAAQTLGFVNAEGLGQYGVEGKLNDRLKGRDGMLQSVTDVSNVPLTIGDQNVYQPAENGEDIVLSIDRNVQAYAEKALKAGLERTGAQKGSVMVMNPQNGQVMAMANLPSYRPEEFTKVMDGALFNNATVSAPYEAGSVIKAMMVAVGLDKGVIQPDSTYLNTDKIQVGDRTITNATKGQTGVITMQKALNYSLNTGMVTIARLLGDGNTINQQARSTMYEYYHDRFGLGRRTGIEVVGEAAGSVVSPSVTEGNAVRYSNMSFGQGMNVTMVQVCSAFSSLINGGQYFQPTVLAGRMNGVKFEANKAAQPARNVISQQASDKVRTMLYEARHTFHGSSDRQGYEIGGKTGTSQTLVNGVYTDDQTVGTYLGYGGDSAPKYVIMVQVSGKNMNLEGGKHAMPIFTDISNWMIDYLKLQPKG